MILENDADIESTVVIIVCVDVCVSTLVHMFEDWWIFVRDVLDYAAVEDTDGVANIEFFTASADDDLVDNILPIKNVAIPDDTTP